MRHAQAKPLLQGPLAWGVHSDAGFKKEIDSAGHHDGQAVGGANFMLRSTKSTEHNCVHLLDWVVDVIKQVTRSALSSETSAGILATDRAITIQTTLQEIQCGPIDMTNYAPAPIKEETLSGRLIPIVIVVSL